MLAALLGKDASFDGAFFAGVKTTGIFCRPGCGAKKPLARNVEFFPSASEALHAGYRPCRRCRPMDPPGARPAWLARLLAAVDAAPQKRLRAEDLRRMDIQPATAARWFKAHYGMTFQAYHRARRVGMALRRIREGGSMTTAQMAAGYASESGMREAFDRLFGAPPGRAAKEGAAPLAARWFPTPLGPMLAIASESAVVLLEFVDRRAIEAQVATLRRRIGRPVEPGDNAVLRRLGAEFELYLAGKLEAFTTPIEAPGTAFQQRVWSELRTIPAGETRSYAEIARAIGRPTAVRAVARANGDNRVAILIPCHRVVGSDGGLTGYAGGIWRKEWLLKHERGRG